MYKNDLIYIKYEKLKKNIPVEEKVCIPLRKNDYLESHNYS